VQIYDCTADGWVLREPAAAIVRGDRAVALRYVGPTWQSVKDGSRWQPPVPGSWCRLRILRGHRVRSQTEAKAAMDRWEQTHPDLCVPLADRTLMIGGGGDIDLGALVEFVLVPAVRDAALDAAESRTGGFRQLVELLVRTRLDVGEQLAALREEIDARYAEIISNDGDTILAETSTVGHHGAAQRQARQPA
jgi:hypothetical protein